MNYKLGDILPPQFRLGKQLGVGGFSEVWSATDEQARVEVAVKIFLKQDQEGIDLCREEYQRMTYLRHPNILQPRYFSSADGAPFIVMPLCEIGSTMNRIGQFSEAQLARMMAQIGGALSHIHAMAQPILHNDIKPDNILEEQADFFVLADFGISERLSHKFSQSIPDEERRTIMLSQDRRAGITAMAYRAPELFSYAGRAKQRPSKATDIWAFGATIYQLASGELPFDNEGGLRQLGYQATNQLVEMDHTLSDLPNEYSSGLSQVLKRCMAFFPHDRPSAEEVAEWAKIRLQTGVWPQLPNTRPISPQQRPVRDNVLLVTPNRILTPMEYDDFSAGRILVSTHSIDFGPATVGHTATQLLNIGGADGLSGMVHVAVTAPFAASLPGQPPLRSFDLALTPDSRPHTIEVHFEPLSPHQFGGELSVSHPNSSQQRVALRGIGAVKKPFPIWILVAVLSGLLLVTMLLYLLRPGTASKPVAQPDEKPKVEVGGPKNEEEHGHHDDENLPDEIRQLQDKIEHKEGTWEDLYTEASKYILSEDEHLYDHPSAYCWVICAAEKAIESNQTQDMYDRMTLDCPGEIRANDICRLKKGHLHIWDPVRAALRQKDSEALEKIEEAMVEKWEEHLKNRVSQ